MKIAVFGAGYVGLVSGSCFSDMGNSVIIYDNDSEKINDLDRLKIPIYEPGLYDLIRKNHSEGRLQFTNNVKRAISESDLIFIAVGTPEGEDGSTDITQVIQAAEIIGRNLDKYKIIIIKSTVPVGTNESIKNIIKSNLTSEIPFDMVSNPEFLREGTAIRDFMLPDRIVLGSDSGKAFEIMTDLYQGIAHTENPIICTSIQNAEIIKYASNAMLSARISFMNQLVPLCEKYGADIKEISKGMGYDDRIGTKFLQAGIGFGGSCLHKDVSSLSYILKENGFDNSLIQSIIDINKKQKIFIVEKMLDKMKELEGAKIAIWGLSFKPDTDDIRESPSIDIISELLDYGATINVYDPQANNNMRQIFPEVNYFNDPYSCAAGCNAIVLVTEWSIFKNLEFKKILESMKDKFLFDGRNIYDKFDMNHLGFKYYGIGR